MVEERQRGPEWIHETTVTHRTEGVPETKTEMRRNVLRGAKERYFARILLHTETTENPVHDRDNTDWVSSGGQRSLSNLSRHVKLKDRK